MKDNIKYRFLSFLIPIIVLAVWYVSTKSGSISPVVLPAISKVIESFKEQIISGQLMKDISSSLIRVLKGYSIAVVSGVSIGTIMGMSKVWNNIFSLTLHTIRQIPMKFGLVF